MELSWSSFILEIINFIVLVWILKHFFYKPISNLIIKRRMNVQESLDQAKKLHDEALLLQDQYNNRLKEWELEKNEKQKAFQQTLEEWKSQEWVSFKKTVEKEKEKINAREMRRISSMIETNANESMVLASKFITRLLKDFSDADLEKKIIDKVIRDLSCMPDEEKNLLLYNLQGLNNITVKSAYPIIETQKENLINAIQRITQSTVDINFSQNSDLLSGLNIQFNSVTIQASLKDELKFFTEIEKYD